MTLAAESGFLFKRFTMKTFFAVNYKFVFRNVNIFFLPSIKQNSRKGEFSFFNAPFHSFPHKNAENYSEFINL